MKTLVQVSLTLVTCYAVTGKVSGFSKSMLNFMTTFNGVFDNSDQVKFEGARKDTLQAVVIPVAMSAFPETPSLYMEEDLNDVVYRMQLFVVSEVKDDIISVTNYNFTDPSKYKPRTYNISDISTLRREDLRTDESCKLTIQIISNDIYVLMYSDCRHILNGKHPVYYVTITCDNNFFTLPKVAREKSSDWPYNLKRQGDKFPVPGAPKDFVGPCNKRRS